VQHVQRYGNMLHVQHVHVARSHAQECNVRLWPTSRDCIL